MRGFALGASVFLFLFYVCLRCALQTNLSVTNFPLVPPVSAMQTQVENLALELFYMENMDQDMQHRLLLMKQSAKRAEAERIQAEVEKQKQVPRKTVFAINKCRGQQSVLEDVALSGGRQEQLNHGR